MLNIFTQKIQQLQRENLLIILRSTGSVYEEQIIAQLTEQYSCVDLAQPMLRMQAEQDAAAFVRSLSLPVYLANLQCVPAVLTELLQKQPDFQKLIISCTQSYYLEQLAEDKPNIHFFDLPIAASCAAHIVASDNFLNTLTKQFTTIEVLQKIVFGTLCGDKVRDDYFAAYLKRVLQQDIIELTSVNDYVKFYRYLCAVAKMAGKVVNFAKLAEASGITPPTAKVWMKYLLGTGMVYELSAVQNIGLKRLVKTPKVYFRDTALACYLLQLADAAELLAYDNFEELFENYTVNVLRESYINEGECAKLLFYRDNNRKEINLIMVEAGILYPMLMTSKGYSAAKVQKNFTVLNEYAEREAYAIGNGCILTLEGETRKLNESMWHINVRNL